MKLTMDITVMTAKEILIGYLKDQDYHFITPTPLTHQRVNARPDHGSSRDLTDAFGWNRPFDGGLLPADILGSLEEEGIVARSGQQWISKVRASTIGDDLFLHSGFPTTDADAVFFGPDTYRFCRLIRQRLSGRKVHRALDLGCGSGAGGVAVARNSECRDITLTDINDHAIAFCKANLRGCGLTHLNVMKSDPYDRLDGSYDFIVANPPYLNDPLKRAYRHGGGPFGASLSIDIAVGAIGKLAPGGTLVLYTGSAIIDGADLLKNELQVRFSGAPVSWAYEEIDPDVFGEELELTSYNHVDRIAVVALTVDKTGS